MVSAVGPWAIFLLAWAPAAQLLRHPASGRGAVLLVASALWIALVQGDSVLGPLARLEWGDGDLLFQGYFPYLEQHSSQRFLPELMGGTDRYSLGRIGGEFFSLRLLLLHIMPLWAVTVLLRFAVSSVAMLGMYLFCHRQAGAPRETAFALGMLFAVAFDFTATMPFLYGFSLAGMPLLLYALFAQRLGLFAVFGTIYIGTADPIYWLPLLWLSAIAIRTWTKPKSDAQAVMAMIGLSVAWLANYADTLLAFADMLPWSNRDSAASLPLFTLLRMHFDWLLSPIIWYNHGGVVFLLPLTVAVLGAVVFRDWRAAAAALATAAIGIFPPFLSAISWADLGLPLFSSYRWYWEYGALFLAFFACARSCTVMHAAGYTNALRVVAGGLIALSIAMIFLFKSQVFLLSVTRGNLSALTSIPNLKNRAWQADASARVVGIPAKIDPNSLVNYGFSNLDGGATLVHRDLHSFWSHVVRQPNVLGREFLGFAQHPAFLECCAPLDIDRLADLDLLRLANVGYIVSYRALRSSLLTQVSGPAVQVKPTVHGQLLEPAAPAFVYRLAEPLPLVYAARGVVPIPDTMPVAAIFDTLRQEALSMKAVMKASDVAAMGIAEAASSGSKIQFRWVSDAMSIELADWKGGMLLVNVPYLPWWQARTDGNAIVAIKPANLIQMAINVPAGTSSLQLEYRRPLLRERLLGRLF